MNERDELNSLIFCGNVRFTEFRVFKYVNKLSIKRNNEPQVSADPHHSIRNFRSR